jgi:redox-sensing transcriptional repressor
VALFDNDREKIGRLVGDAGVTVYDVKRVERVVREQGIDVAVIAVPARAAQKVLNPLTATGIKAVLNFAPARLRARLGVKLKTVDLTISLESLSYFLARPQSSAVTKTSSAHPFEEPREVKNEPDKARRKETT